MTNSPISSVRGSVHALSGLRGLAVASSACCVPASADRRNRREASGTVIPKARATASRWTTTGTPNATMTAPTAAPPTVPTLKPAWNFGMIARRRRCSTAAPSTFMATFQTPLPKPTRASPTIVGGMPTSVPTATTARPIARQIDMVETVRAAPRRATMSPASGTAITAPRPPPSKIKPSVDGLACSSSRIAGMREAQLAKPKPLLMKAVATARFAVSAAVSADTCLRSERSACSGSWGSGSNMTGPRYRPAGQGAVSEPPEPRSR